ncbi:MAG TPA: 4Fe-4S dicluster domain-containing protein, partial [Candidatus Bathyarchaeota archaeon]|nr:4Fe-4S dicluster domain-containing protein [Candidatus Bathyarchaeota archaeon]
FMEAHPKLRPIETLVDGVFVAGCCQGPKDIQISVAQGAAAAAKAASVLAQKELEIEPLVASVDEERCRGCGRCEEVCEFGAISVVEKAGRLVAQVNEAICKGCGACSVRCPTGAVRVRHFMPEQIRAQALAAAGGG